MMPRVRAIEERLDQDRGVPAGPQVGDILTNFRMLPGLRGLWLPGSADNTGAVYDASAQGRTLTYNGNPQLIPQGGPALLVPFYAHDGVGDWFSRATEAGLGLVGNESYVTSASRGCSVFGWFYVTAVSTYKFVAKQDGATEAGSNYVLYTNGGNVTFRVSSGASGYSAADPDDLSINTWHFLVGTYKPSTEVALWVDGKKLGSNVTAIPATLNNPAQPFQIGAGNGGNPLSGGWALAGIAACLFDDALIKYLWYRSRVLFGV